MSTLVFQVLTLLLGAYLAGCVTGSFGRGIYVSARQANAASSETQGALPSSGNNGSDAPVADLSLEDGGNDLTRIEGVDSALAERLNGLGIRRIDQIASWNDAEIEWAEAQLGEKGRVRRQEWVRQALWITGGDSRTSE